ncbi:hypothetical protein [Streptomyces sp. Midd1]|uniref:hypothetical protein n=1 Tax=Streptomyces sp. Midd3 TaxID=3161191 RepID=UPI0034DB79E1
MTGCPDHLVTTWLARSHSVPAEAKKEWEARGAALLTMGERLQAIRLSGRLVHAAVDSDDPDKVKAALEDIVCGPVIRERQTWVGGLYYALISGHAGVTWDYEREAPIVGHGVYLVVPAIHRCEPPGPYWMIPPRFDGDLCRPASVRRLVEMGVERTAARERV